MNNSPINPTWGKITSGINPDTSIISVIDFVYSQLPAWRDNLSHPCNGNEKTLNLDLSKYLNKIAKEKYFMFIFSHEEIQGVHSSVDLSASPSKDYFIGSRLYTYSNPIIIFECKRLPAPKPKRKIEYVTGGLNTKKGGIQRFKLGIHGKDHDLVGMIGYLQADSPNYWFNEINNWITELCNGTMKDNCVWNKSEMLEYFEEDPEKGIAKCRSTHDRNGSVQKNTISIRHLWVKM